MNIRTLLDVFTRMSSTGIIIVWACECWAFIRLYHL
jgi:amino acid transporter